MEVVVVEEAAVVVAAVEEGTVTAGRGCRAPVPETAAAETVVVADEKAAVLCAVRVETVEETATAVLLALCEAVEEIAAAAALDAAEAMVATVAEAEVVETVPRGAVNASAVLRWRRRVTHTLWKRRPVRSNTGWIENPPSRPKPRRNGFPMVVWCSLVVAIRIAITTTITRPQPPNLLLPRRNRHSCHPWRWRRRRRRRRRLHEKTATTVLPFPAVVNSNDRDRIHLREAAEEVRVVAPEEGVAEIMAEVEIPVAEGATMDAVEVGVVAAGDEEEGVETKDDTREEIVDGTKKTAFCDKMKTSKLFLGPSPTPQSAVSPVDAGNGLRRIVGHADLVAKQNI